MSETYGDEIQNIEENPRFFQTDAGRRMAWYLYDFGNSAYAAVVILAIYSAYFKEGVVGGAEGIRLWGVAVAIAMLITAIISPILGAIADFSASRKQFLGFFTGICCLFTGMLFFVQKGDVLMGMAFFILAEIGYRSAQVFYNGLLPGISTPSTVGRISGTGWAIGSFGGVVCLLIVLPMVVAIGGNLVLRSTMLVTAAFFLISAIPLFLFVREPGNPKEMPAGKNLLKIGFSQIGNTFANARKYGEYLKFLLAYIFFNDGVMIALNFAAIIGATLHGFERQDLIILIILVQLANVVGAWIFGILADRNGAKRALIISLVMMIGTITWMMINQSENLFYLIGGCAGFAIAGLQSVSRTMVAKLAPSDQAAEFFGLFSVAGRSSSFIGPAIFGWVAADWALQFVGDGMGALEAEQMAIRFASAIIIAFLIVGGALLFWVNEKKGSAQVGNGKA